MDKQTIEYLKTTYPEVITKDQFYRICHISKKTASYLLDNGLVPCTNSGKQTRKYKIRLDDVIAFLDARENNPFAFKAPDNYYGRGAYNPHALNIERLMKNRKTLRTFLNNKIANYDDVIPPSKVAEITGYTLKSVLSWCEKGKLKSFNIFNRVKIPKEYLVDFLVSDEGLLIAKKSKKHIDLLLDALHYGTKRINGYQIIEETLNLKDVRIFDYVEDANGKKTPVLNKKETAIAQGKQEQIKRAFEEWIWRDPERRERLCRLYNEKFNSYRPREYDGSHIQFYGMNPEISLRSHQKNAVARIMYGGNSLLAHVVGAGKTFTMVAAAQESKRLGLCNKSMFVVPNHLIEQWASEYLQLYPSANILVATKKDFETKNRKKFCARIATGDYDAIIIGHSQFEKIPVSVERQIRTLENEIETIMQSKKNDTEVSDYASGTVVSEDGKYTVIVTDEAGNETKTSFVIDKSVSYDVNINDGGLANSVTIYEKENLEFVVTKNGTPIEYKDGTAITEPAEYTVTLTDDIGNKAEFSFTIVEPVVTKFTHNFDDLAGFEKVLVNGNEARLNYGTLEITADGKYTVDVIANGETHSFNVTVDTKVDYSVNAHDKGFANSVKISANESVTATVTKNGEAFKYELGKEITEPATYGVKLVDALGNKVEFSFTIVEPIVGKFEEEIDLIPGFEKVLVNGNETTIEKGTLALTESGVYEVSIIAGGKTQKFTVTVDATAPTLTLNGVENGGATTDAVTLTDVSEEAEVVVTLNGEQIEYTVGDELTEIGEYKVTVTDAYGNATEYDFTIEKGANIALIVILIILGVAAIGTGVFFYFKKKNSI